MAYFFDTFEIKKTDHGKLIGLLFKSSLDEDEWAFVVDADICTKLAQEILSQVKSKKKAEKNEEPSYLM